MNENKAEELAKKHPPWFILDIHPIRFAKRLSEEEQKDEEQTEVDREED